MVILHVTSGTDKDRLVFIEYMWNWWGDYPLPLAPIAESKPGNHEGAVKRPKRNPGALDHA